MRVHTRAACREIWIQIAKLVAVAVAAHPSRFLAQQARADAVGGGATVRICAMDGTLAVANGGFAARLVELWERPETKKARRVGYHVVRATKKFVFGTGNAAWVVGTTVLVMVMPLVFEIDREQQSLEQMGVAQLPP